MPMDSPKKCSNPSSRKRRWSRRVRSGLRVEVEPGDGGERKSKRERERERHSSAGERKKGRKMLKKKETFGTFSTMT